MHTNGAKALAKLHQRFHKSLAESFYYVKYGSSIITSKIVSNENKKKMMFLEK